MGWEMRSNSLAKKKPAESGLYLGGGEGGMTQNNLWAVLPLRASPPTRLGAKCYAFGRTRGFSSRLSNPNENAPFKGALTFGWRRRRDSNPRYAINVYSLSRGAPSATRPLLQIPFIQFLANVSFALPGRALLGALHLALRVAAVPPALLRSLGLLGQPLGHFS